MTNRVWDGSTGDWTTDADWLPAGTEDNVPEPGDPVTIASGTVILTTNTGPNALFEYNTVTLGGAAVATLKLADPRPTGRSFSVKIAGAATIEADGTRGFAGSITGAPADGSTITLKADAGGALVLLHGGSFNVQDATVDFEGAVTLERDATVIGNVINNGTLSILGGTTTLEGGSLTGAGTIAVGGYGTLDLNGAVPSTEAIDLAGAGAVLNLGYDGPGSVLGTIAGFAPGDTVQFLGENEGTIGSASIDTVAHTLTLNDTSGATFVYGNFYGEAGTLKTVHSYTTDGNDTPDLLVTYADGPSPVGSQIGAAARAEHADTVQRLTVPGTGTLITGAGVKVGIISNSFNVLGGAGDDAANGYLPAGGVTVLREGSAGGDDEGRAMAELVHQIAPGAGLYFASTGDGVDDFATSVQALQAAGCTVIVDDIGLIGSEPFFQLGSPAENAISAASAAGVTFVSSAGNYADAYYQHAFTTTQQTLVDGTVVQAMIFGDGTPYQTFTATGSSYDTIDLQWDAPFYGTGGVASDQPDSVMFKVFDSADDTVVGTSQQVTLDGHLVAESELTLPYSDDRQTYRLAIYHADGTPDVGTIKYILSGAATGASAGGRIYDSDAGTGSGDIFGHALVPGDISVAATDVANTAEAGQTPDFTDYFSSTGPGTLLFDAQGNRLTAPLTVGSPDVTGVDAVNTSVPGFVPFYGTSAAAPDVAGVVALMQQVQPGLTPSAASLLLRESALPLADEPTALQGAGLVQADRAIALEEMAACYCRGTRIRTADGETAVEALVVGDLVLTLAGTMRRIKWIGRRSYGGRFVRARPALLPICITAGAIDDCVPCRDLWVSPQHAMYLDGVLIEAKDLVNGITILQPGTVGTVEYFHVELESHDVMLAEGAWAESFADDGDRSMFHNTVEYTELYPQEGPGFARYCAPRVDSGFELDVVRRRLLERAPVLAASACFG